LGGREEKVLELIKEKCFCVLEVQSLHKRAVCNDHENNEDEDNENKNDNDADHVWHLHILTN
jgi:hypothetical protein